MQFQPGDRLDHFTILRFLGRGGMGEVYLARDTRLGRKVALKLLLAEQMRDAQFRGMFVLEARATAQFNHPHIVTIYDVGEYQEYLYMALEYLEGDTLQERLEQERFSVGRAVEVGLAVAEALAEAHKHQILHRDLKPANVFLPKDGRVRVLDLGLARQFKLKSGEVSSQAIEEAQPTKLEKETLEQMLHPGAAIEDTMAYYEGEETVSPGQSWDSLNRMPLEGSGEAFCGTPMYMAPEQWMQEDITPASDVWALGLVLFEMFAGRRPFPELSMMERMAQLLMPRPVVRLERFVEIPQLLSDLVAHCLEKDPQKRPDMAFVVEQLKVFLSHHRFQDVEVQNPFRGLRAFSPEHAQFFFGREQESRSFLERLREEPVLSVIGPSGTGKSSFVYAGVLARLQEQGQWETLSMKPGRSPFLTLANRLLKTGWFDMKNLPELLQLQTSQVERFSEWSSMDALPAIGTKGTESSFKMTAQRMETPEEVLAEALEHFPSLLASALHQYAEKTGKRLLLFVDQLEELYTLVEEQKSRRRWMRSLLKIADDPQDPIRVVLTLRDDFLGRLAESPESRAMLHRVTVLAKLTSEHLKDILTQPLQMLGYTYDDPILVSDMIDEVSGSDTALPLLQFAAGMLWDERDTRKKCLRRESYEKMGGVVGALAHHAETLLETYTAEEIALVRKLCLRLVTSEHTRQVMPRGSLLEGLGNRGAKVLDALVDSRLISIRKASGQEGKDTELELTHEALITSWKQLVTWLEENREEHQFLQELHQAVHLWEKRGCPPNEVWQGKALHEAVEVFERWGTKLSEKQGAFLQAGKRLEQQVRERGRRIRNVFLMLMGIIAVISTVFALTFLQQRKLGTWRLAESFVERARNSLLQKEPHKAYAKLRVALTLQTQNRGDISISARSLWWKLQQTSQLWKVPLQDMPYQMSIRKDGQLMAIGCMDRSILLLDLRTLQQKRLVKHKEQVLTVAFSPDGRFLASGDHLGVIRLWNTKDWTSRVLMDFKEPSWSVAFDEQGTRLAVSDQTGRFALYDAKTWKKTFAEQASRKQAIWRMEFSPDGKTLGLVQGHPQIELWSLEKQPKRSLLTVSPKFRWQTLAFHPTKPILATAGHKGAFVLWDLKSKKRIHTFVGHHGLVFHIAFSPDGERLASASWDRTVRIWSMKHTRSTRVFQNLPKRMFQVAFHPKYTEQLLTLSTTNKAIRLWNLNIQDEQDYHNRHHSAIISLAFHPSGKMVASGSQDTTVRLWSTRSGELLRVLKGHKGGIWCVAFHPNGRWLASSSSDQSIRLWDLKTGRLLRVFLGHGRGVMKIIFDKEGKRLFSSGRDGAVRLWEVKTGRPLRTYPQRGHGGVISVALSPDEKTLAAGYWSSKVILWDVETGAETYQLRSHKGAIWALAFRKDGKSLLSGSEDGTVRLWDLETKAHTIVARHKSRIFSLKLFRDNKRFVVSSGIAGFGGMYQWSLGQKKPITLYRGKGDFVTFALHPNERTFAFASHFFALRLWERKGKRSQAVWKAPYVHRKPVTMLSHRGWKRLEKVARVGSSLRAPTTKPIRSWQKPFLQGKSVRTSASRDGKRLCLIRPGGNLEFWDLTKGSKLFSLEGQDIQQLMATAKGCLILQKGSLFLQTQHTKQSLWLATAKVTQKRITAKNKRLTQPLRWFAPALGKGTLWVATQKKLFRIRHTGTRLNRYEVGVGATALQERKDGILLGYASGQVRFYPFQKGVDSTRSLEKEKSLSFQKTPGAEVLHFASGPMGTVFVGFANGVVGHWETGRGVLLYQERLHGSIRYLFRKKEKLYAVSKLGDTRILDLRTFSEKPCSILRHLWRSVSTVWSQNRLHVQKPPLQHPCLLKKN